MTQLLRLDQRAAMIGQVLKDNRKTLMASIPPVVGDRERFFATMYNSIAYNVELLEVASVKPGLLSIFSAIQETMRLGIEIGGAMGECWLIPFNDSKLGCKIAQLIVGYQGMRNIAGRSKSVLDLMAYAVFEGDDEFDFQYGDQPRIVHRPGRKNPKNRDTLVAAYAVCHLRGGGKQILVMYREEIEEHRERSKAAKSAMSPWNHPKDYIEMAKKTPVRGLFKMIPKNTDMARVVETDERADRGETVIDIEGLVLPPELQPEPAAGGGKLDQLTEKLKGASEPPSGELSADAINWSK
jgi:recombination protein RecT